jgi:transcriptional regulator with XRE-family HTH domain
MSSTKMTLNQYCVYRSIGDKPVLDFVKQITRQTKVEAEGEMLETMGKRLIALQGDLDYSNKDVVDYMKSYGADIDYSHYSRITRDKALPSVQVLTALCKVLDCTSDYLLLLSDTPQHIPAPDVFITTEANEIGAMIDRMDIDMRAHVLRITGELLRINEERRELHAEIADLLGEQIGLLSGQKREKAEWLLGRLSFE